MSQRGSRTETARPHRVRYEKPRLKQFGDVAELTRNASNGSGVDGVIQPNKKTV